MNARFIFTPSAFKHGVDEADIRHAFKIRLFDHPMPGEEDKNLLIGVSRSGVALEILYHELEPQPGAQTEGSPLDNTIIKVFHAMKCRKAYRDFFGF